MRLVWFVSATQRLCVHRSGRAQRTLSLHAAEAVCVAQRFGGRWFVLAGSRVRAAGQT
jgi:hypothetical protein